LATLTATDPLSQPSFLTSASIALMADAVNRRRISAVLDRLRLEVVATGTTVAGVLGSARSGFDVAILLGGPELLGRGNAIETLRSVAPDCSLVVVSPSTDRSLVRKAVLAGVDGILHHTDVDRVLPVTLMAVLAGQLSVPRTVRNRIAWSSLSLRERQVLQLVADGLTNSEVASQLYLSESTVKSHLSSSFRKLGVASRAEAAAAVLDPERGLAASFAPVGTPLSLERELLGSVAA
jgi:DNA-binding NarL/FixJ family response regulator